MKTHGHLSDAQVQDRLRNMQRRRERQIEEDLRALMGQEWGRRLAYWLAFELGRLDAPSFVPDIKDGVCAAMHMSRAEGIREMAGAFLARVRDLTPEPYLAMMSEQVRTRQADLAMKPTESGDNDED